MVGSGERLTGSRLLRHRIIMTIAAIVRKTARTTAAEMGPVAVDRRWMTAIIVLW